MNIGILIFFIVLIIYSFYSFIKTRKNIYLIIGTFVWYGAIYSGKQNVYQFIQDPFKLIINIITVFLLLMMLSPYFKKSFNDYKKYKKSNNEHK